jgi:hypothetical protein
MRCAAEADLEFRLTKKERHRAQLVQVTGRVACVCGMRVE